MSHARLDSDVPSPPRRQPGFFGLGCMIVFVAAMYLLFGLIAGLIFSLNTTDWLGDNESLITDPQRKQRIDGLASLCEALWFIGGVAIGIGWFLIARRPQLSSLAKRVTIGAMVGLPALWIVFSIWVIAEGNEAVNASKTPTAVPSESWSTERDSAGIGFVLETDSP